MSDPASTETPAIVTDVADAVTPKTTSVPESILARMAALNTKYHRKELAWATTFRSRNGYELNVDLNQALTHMEAGHDLLTMSFDKVKVTETQIDRLAVCLAAPSASLHHLNLHHAGLTDDAIARLSEALAQNHSLRTLSLHHNDITDVGIKALATALRTNTSLEVLHLRWNKYTSVGVAAVCAALTENTDNSVEELSFCHNDIDDDALSAVIDLASHKATSKTQARKVSLTKVYMFDNKFTDAGAALLARFIAAQVCVPADGTKDESSRPGTPLGSTGSRRTSLTCANQAPSLFLAQNCITDVGRAALTAAVSAGSAYVECSETEPYQFIVKSQVRRNLRHRCQ